jgi:hypothetical protein
MALRKTKIGRLLLAGIAAALLVVLAWVAIDEIGDYRTAKAANAHAQEIVSILGLKATPDFHQQLDKVRTFVNDNSDHEIDDAFRANQGNLAAFAAGVLAHAKGKSPEPIHMECSTRTTLMVLILGALGYETRVVAIFNSRTNLKSHSFLEVKNPKTGHWETQDADFDIYWRSKNSGERISLADTAEIIDDIEPCGRDTCGWDHVSPEGRKADKLKSYLDIISITDRQRDIRYALFTSRADLTRTYRKGSEQGAFCEVEDKRCKQGFYDIRKYSSYAAGLPR